MAVGCVAVGALSFEHAACAVDTATTVWNGTSATYSTTGNWNNGIPSATLSAKFSTAFTTQPSVTGTATTQGIWLATGVTKDVTITGSTASRIFNLTGTATLSGQTNAGIILDDTANHNLTLASMVVTLTNDTGFYVNNAATLTIDKLNLAGKTLTLAGSNPSGVITLSGVIGTTLTTGALVINTSGTVNLNAANVFTGGTTLTAGTLVLGSAGTLGAAAGDLTVNGGTLNLNGTSQAVGNFTGTAGTILNNSTGTNAVFTIGTSSTATTGNFSGTIVDHTSGTGTVALTKVGTGTITLSGNNAYTGATTVSAGTLKMGVTNALSSSTALVVGTSGGSAGGAVFDLNGKNQSVASLQLNGGATAATNSGSIKLGGGTLTVNGNIGYETGSSTTDYASTISGAGALDLGGASRTFNVYDNGNNVATYGGDLQISSVIQNGGIIKAQGGILTLSGANTFTGGVTINAGTLALGSAGALNSTTPNVVAFGASSTGDLQLNGNSVTVAGLDTNATVGTPIVENASATAATLTTSIAGTSTYGGVIRNGTGSGALSLVKSGVGTLNLTGANTYTGGTTIQNGTVQLSGGNDRLAATSTVTLGSASTTGKLILGNSTSASNQTLAGLTATGAGGSVVGGNTSNSTLTTNVASGTNTYAGTLGGAGTNENNLALVKTGAGVLALNGNNTYVGGTTIAAGSVTANTSTALGTGTVVVNSALYNAAGTNLGNNITLNGITNSAAAYTTTYNFDNTTSPTTPSSSTGSTGVTGGAVSQGNNNGTTTLITATTPSSGYTGASGSNNAGAAAITGSLVTGTGGSAYFQFTLTPAQANTFSLSSLSFGSRSTGTGPASFTLRSSADSYGADLALGTLGTNSTWALYSGTPAITSATAGSAITFRLYGYNGTGSPSAGTANWRIDDLTLGGNVLTPAAGTAILGSQSTSGTTTYSGAITLTSAAALTSALGGTVAITGNIAESGGSFGVTKTGAGVVMLSGSNSYSGATLISNGTLGLANVSGTALSNTASVAVNVGGTLLFGAANQIATPVPISLSGGTIQKAASSDQGTTSTAGIGALTLTAASKIDFTQTNGILNFTSFTDATNVVLTISNYVGNGSSGGVDQLIFGTDVSRMTGDFDFGFGAGNNVGVVSLGNNMYEVYSIVAIPEPATCLGGVLLVGATGWSQRRRLRGLYAGRRSRAMA